MNPKAKNIRPSSLKGTMDNNIISCIQKRLNSNQSSKERAIIRSMSGLIHQKLPGGTVHWSRVRGVVNHLMLRSQSLTQLHIVGHEVVKNPLQPSFVYKVKLRRPGH